MGPVVQRRAADGIRRRGFVSLAGSAALTWPFAAWSQQRSLPVVGYISAGSRSEVRRQIEAFERGIARMGFVDGRNVEVAYRFAEGRYERIPEFAAELVSRRVDVICSGNNAGALAAKAATSNIPIVFVVGVDPVSFGLVSRLSRPDGNATGISFLASELEPKRLELVRELVPQHTLAAALINPDNPNAQEHATQLQAAARTVGLRLLAFHVRTDGDIAGAFATLVQQNAAALLVTIDPFLLYRRRYLIELADQHRVPTVYPLRDFADDGGLLSYGNDLADATQEMGVYAGRILLGVKPASLPVIQPTKFELVVNMQAARKIGFAVPEAVLSRADEVIG